MAMYQAGKASEFEHMPPETRAVHVGIAVFQQLMKIDCSLENGTLPCAVGAEQQSQGSKLKTLTLRNPLEVFKLECCQHLEAPRKSAYDEAAKQFI